MNEISASDGLVIGLDEATRGCLEWQELLNSTSNYFFSGEKCDRPGPLDLKGGLTGYEVKSSIGARKKQKQASGLISGEQE